MSSLPSLTRRFFGLATGLVLLASLAAQQPQRDYSFTDDTSEALPKFKTALDAKPPDYATALSVLAGLQAKVPADSYDAAYIFQWRSGIYIQQGDYAKALEPMERALALSESKTPTYFDERQSREAYFFLVQLHFQEGTQQTKNPKLAAASFDKAEKAMLQWLKLTPQSSVDGQLVYAQVLLNKALLIPDKPDAALLQRTLEQVEIGLKLSIRPKDTFYLLKLVCLQQLDRFVESAELLELLVKLKPDSTTYWQQLAAIYLTLAANSEGKDAQAVTAYSTRAIVTFERAQANGFMNALKDNGNLVAIYFNIGQYEKTAELLETGLKAGSIENDTKNWELLFTCYQQLQRPLKGVDALKQGIKAFPKSGQLEYQIGMAYNSLEKPAEALPHFQAAIAKGGLSRPHQAYLALSYAAYSTQKYDVALEAAKKAAEFPEGATDGKNMQKALEDLIKDREQKKNRT
jgi:tetratricopeptide (TPR) repeat protein